MLLLQLPPKHKKLLKKFQIRLIQLNFQQTQIPPSKNYYFNNNKINSLNIYIKKCLMGSNCKEPNSLNKVIFQYFNLIYIHLVSDPYKFS